MGFLTNMLSNPQFSEFELTTYINAKKPVPKLLTGLLQPQEKGTYSDGIWVEKRNRGLQLIPFSPRGGDPTHLTQDKRSLTALKIPRIAMDSTIHADEFMGVRAPGSADQLWLIRDIINERLASIADRMDATLEYHLLNMLKGLVLDADGTTTWHNIYTELGVTAPTEIAMDLTQASPPEGAVTKRVNTAKRAGMDGLDEVDASRWMVGCGRAFWDDLTANKEVRDSFRFETTSDQLFRQNLVEGAFVWRGITWFEYGKVVNGSLLLDTNKAIMFPVDAPIYEVKYAPADYITDIGSIPVGLPRYVPTPTVDPANPNNPKYIRVDSQTNPLAFCTRPAALIPLRRGA